MRGLKTTLRRLPAGFQFGTGLAAGDELQSICHYLGLAAESNAATIRSRLPFSDSGFLISASGRLPFCSPVVVTS